ncbi:carbonic anhydrase [Litorimonas sp. WD9-15]|uniref:carbonic anhydrase n=1 Tax=Litorimonas sp. WD9-15 TaxID=3418716 RepID=UPI003D063416
MERLVKGYQSFRAGDYGHQKALYEELGREGQHPDIMLIACADSRVDPTDIFDAYPGQMFVARNVANLVPPPDLNEGFHGTTAAIEYAVKVIGVDMIVVMGHESCGGIQGCIAGLGREPEGGYVNKWLSQINHVHDRVSKRGLSDHEMQFEMELETVRQSIANLMQYDFVQERVEAGTLSLQGAYFSIIQARLMLADERGEFKLIDISKEA